MKAMLYSLRKGVVAQPQQFTIILTTILVLFILLPANVPAATKFAAATKLSFTRLGNGWSVEVKIRNQLPFAICMTNNYTATSRLTFFDSLGRRVEAGGFEGRPVNGCRRLSPNLEASVTYNHSQFPSLNILRVRRICYREYWRNESGTRRGVFGSCVNLI